MCFLLQLHKQVPLQNSTTLHVFTFFIAGIDEICLLKIDRVRKRNKQCSTCCKWGAPSCFVFLQAELRSRVEHVFGEKQIVKG